MVGDRLRENTDTRTYKSIDARAPRMNVPTFCVYPKEKKGYRNVGTLVGCQNFPLTPINNLVVVHYCVVSWRRRRRQ